MEPTWPLRFPIQNRLVGTMESAMTCAMRALALLLVPLLMMCPAGAQSLSPADREALLERLEALQASADSRVDERFRTAISAYRAASASDQAALELHMNCIEKVNFKDQHRKNSDFRDWKRREDDKLSAPGLGLALRLQLSWLTLTLRAASEKTDRETLVSEVQQIIDAIVRDADKLKDHKQVLNQAVNSSFFARAYDLGTIKVEDWPLSPGQLGEVYDQILLPPHRRPDRVAALRAGWTKRIQQEMALQDSWSGESDPGSKRIGTAAALRSPEYELFVSEALPELQWKMELDLFRSGDEKTAALNMLAHLEKNIGHKSAREWAEEFSELLNPTKTPAVPGNL
jgi:hypothetical protein